MKNISISFEAACYILLLNEADKGSMAFAAEFLNNTCLKNQAEVLLYNGDKIKYTENLGWFIQTYHKE